MPNTLASLLFALVFSLIAASEASACTPINVNNPSSSFMRPVTCLEPGLTPRGNGGHFLSGFDLSFANGDHKPQAFGVAHPTPLIMELFEDRGFAWVFDGRPFRNSTAVVLADPDERDPLDATLFYEPHNRTLPIFEVRLSDCNGPCRITLNDRFRLQGNAFLIRGFLFLRDTEFDDNIRTIAILPQCPADGGSCILEVNYQDTDTRETYDAIVQFSVLPQEALIGRSPHVVERTDDDTQVRRSRTVTTTFRQNRPGGAAVGIERFELRYTSSDHFLGRIAIFPDEMRGARIMMRDGGDDDAFTKVGYNVTLLGIDRNWLAIAR